MDYLNPVIADGDTGFGGTTSVMKLTKMMIEAGAAGMHLEDQRSGSKKCGHVGLLFSLFLCKHPPSLNSLYPVPPTILYPSRYPSLPFPSLSFPYRQLACVMPTSVNTNYVHDTPSEVVPWPAMAGKVLTSTAEHIDRLCAARLQADISGSELVIISRTDAEAANLIDSNIDPRDAPFILGEVGYGEEPVLKTFPDAVVEQCTELAAKHSAVGPSMQAGGVYLWGSGGLGAGRGRGSTLIIMMQRDIAVSVVSD